MHDYEISLGKRVKFTTPLRRVYEHRMDGDRGSNWKVWKAALSYAGPLEGILIGVRTLSDGLVYYGSFDEPTSFDPKESFKAALIATDLKRKPFFVRFDDLQPAE